MHEHLHTWCSSENRITHVPCNKYHRSSCPRREEAVLEGRKRGRGAPRRRMIHAARASHQEEAAVVPCFTRQQPTLQTWPCSPEGHQGLTLPGCKKCWGCSTGWLGCQDHRMLGCLSAASPCRQTKIRGRDFFFFFFFPSLSSLPSRSSFFFCLSDKGACLSSVNYVLWR